MPQIFGKPSSRADWLKLPEAKRGFKTYDRYKAWWNSTVAPRFTVSDNPFAPIPFGAQKAMVSQQVSSAINPIIKSFEDSISRRSTEGSRAINQATDTFVKGAQPLAGNLGAVYDQSIESQQGTNANLVQFLKDSGGYAASELGKMIPDQDEGAAVSAAQKFGTGLAGQEMAQGASTLGRLYSDRAADVGYGTKLPGYAQAFGTEGLQDFQRQLNLQRDEGLADIRSQVPGLVSGAMQNFQSSELQKAIARRGFQMDEKKLNTPAPADYSWRGGPASQKYVTDPATGDQYPNPNYDPGSGPNDPGTLQKRLDTTTKEATKLATTLFTPDVLNGKLGPAVNEKAYAQVLSFIRQRHPNMNTNQILTMTRRALAAGGYLKANGPGFDKWVAKVVGGAAPSTSTPAGAAPTVQQRPTAQPTGPAPPDVIARNPVVTENQANTAANEKKQTAREQNAAQAASGFIQGLVRENSTKPTNQRLPFLQAKKQVIALLQRQMPGHPYKRIIALANQVMAQYPSRYGK